MTRRRECATSCCSTTCEIGEDPFGTDGSGAPSGWTQREGTVDGVSGGLVEITTSNTLMLFNTAHPDGIASAIVEVDVYFGDVDEGIIIFDHDGSDDDNFFFVQFTPYFLSLWQMASGTPSLLHCVPANNGGNPSTITAYFDGETSGMFAATNGTASVWTDVGTGHTGTYVGLGTRSVPVVVAFDNFVATKYKQGSNGCEEFAPPECLVATDDFGRPDDTDPGCPWDELAGTGGIVSGKYVFTATTSRAVFLPSVPNGVMSVTVSFSGTTSANTIEVGVGSTSNASALWYARLAVGATKDLIIGSLAAGNLATLSGINTTVAGTYTITVTLSNGRLCASLTDDDGVKFISTPVTVPTGERYATLGTRTIVSGSIAFDNLSVSQGYDEASSPTCSQCGSSGPDCDEDCCPEAATELTLTIPVGLTNLTNCNVCARLAGDFVITWTPGFCCASYSDSTADETCDDGAESDNTCISSDVDGSAEVLIKACIEVDDDNQCYLAVAIALTVGIGDPGILALGSYISDAPISPCDGSTITLNLYTGAEQCKATANLFVAEKYGCSGAWPSTITAVFA